MTYKTIISGRLEFGNAKTFDKVSKMYQQRIETFYRTAELMFKGEDIFDASTTSLTIPRLVVQATDKSWQNTLDLLDYVVQFAVAGDLRAWMTDNGKVIREALIEPNSDKAAVRAYLAGRELTKKEGREKEAREALSSAIEKYERHALAYERRGYVNFVLKNYADALYDYTKSIDINPNNAAPYFGRAFVKMQQDDLVGAIADFDQAVKRSIPLQSIYWKSRRIKAECHLRLQEFEQAATELKLVVVRTFVQDDSNYKWRQKAWCDFGRALSATGKYADAVQAFDQALKIEDAHRPIAKEDLLQLRELAAQQLSKPMAANA
ncbi:MAG TPA: tetratricopeptide repeat protein [Saprospiraceae bacterium]|nr:tetratricopeptide repeat protein [Saprospiraceae bacterium]HMP12308.1 tetratricopeptide repeat protein [Saprospiraceae bacterium]